MKTLMVPTVAAEIDVKNKGRDENEKTPHPMLKLALIWYKRGDIENAIKSFRGVLQLDSDDVIAHAYLAMLLLKQNKPAEALEHLRTVIHLRPEDQETQKEVGFLERLVNPPSATERSSSWKSNPAGKLKFRDPRDWSIHRSGWGMGMAALKPLHNHDGILFDGFLEDLFSWQHKRDDIRPADELLQLFRDQEFEYLATSEEKGLTPYHEPWGGFFHNPPHMPSWFHGNESPRSILDKPVMQRSLPYCRGLFALSEYHADWLRKETGKVVSSLILPTEIPNSQFEFDKFMQNRDKRVVQIGWWLRQQTAIYQLPIWEDNPLGYTKMRLVPKFFDGAETYLQSLLELEMSRFDVKLTGRNLVKQTQLSNHAYDWLLTENVVFLSLFDASANNTVVECIARATPLLVNRHPAVIEYLGEDYPLFYGDFKDAAAKLLDVERLKAAHVYLKECPTRQKLSADYFRNAFEQSEVYSLLETV
ncbi:MAG: tetratricopeptide repeat protein [Anaerolineae bacterium]